MVSCYCWEQTEIHMLLMRIRGWISVVWLKLTACSRPSAPLTSSPKCVRFGHWLTLSTLNIDLLTYLLNYKYWGGPVCRSVVTDGLSFVSTLHSVPAVPLWPTEEAESHFRRIRPVMCPPQEFDRHLPAEGHSDAWSNSDFLRGVPVRRVCQHLLAFLRCRNHMRRTRFLLWKIFYLLFQCFVVGGTCIKLSYKLCIPNWFCIPVLTKHSSTKESGCWKQGCHHVVHIWRENLCFPFPFLPSSNQSINQSIN